MQQWVGVILAAGDGARMKSRIPKSLHRVCGKELIRYPVELLQSLGVERVIVVVSPGNRTAIEGLLGASVEYAVQPRPLGTADALACAMPLLDGGCSHILLQKRRCASGAAGVAANPGRLPPEAGQRDDFPDRRGLVYRGPWSSAAG